MISRRSLLIGAGGLAAAAVPLSVIASASASSTAGPRPPAPSARRIPQTRLHSRARRSGGTTVASAAFTLSHLGIAWTGESAAVRLRTASGWGDWQPVRGCEAEAGGGAALVSATGVIGYEVQTDGGEIAAVELNTVDGPLRTTAAPESALPVMARRPVDPPTPRPEPSPRYLSRAAWGADESLRVTTTPLSFYPVSTLTVHHEGGRYDPAQELAHVRALYTFQTTRAAQGGSGLDDLGYHLLIGATGTVYEGRWSGTDLVPVFGPGAGPNGLPQMVNGAHLPGFNAGNVGICLLGDYTAAPPAEAVYESLAAVLATLGDACLLDPTGTTNYVNPADVANPAGPRPPRSATVATITTHRDWHAANPQAGSTDCPGAAFHPTMDRVRTDTAGLMKLL